MKKLFLLFALVITNVTLSFADGSITLVRGDSNCLKESEDAVFLLDLSEARFEKKDDFKAWCGSDYAERVNLMENSFVSNFNDSFKLKISKSNTTAKYTVSFQIKNFVRKLGNFGGARAWIRVFGTIEIIDNTTHDTICVFEVDGIGGKQDFVETERFPKAMSKVVEKLSKLINK